MTIDLKYPQTIAKTGFFLNFIAYDYKTAPGIKKTDGTTAARTDIRTNLGGLGTSLETLFSGQGANDPLNQNVDQLGNTADGSGQAALKGSVSLYVPQNLEYSYGANWQAMQFGILGASLGKGAGAAAANALGIGTATAGNVLGDYLAKATNVIPKVSNVDLDNLVGGAFGVTFNDNTLQTFDSMQPREFTYKYILVSRNQPEEIEIRKIIKFFKAAMHPASTSATNNNTVFLKYPYIFQIRPSGYNTTIRTKLNNKVSIATGNESTNFIPRTRYCGLKSLNVSYTPNNVISLTPGSFVTAAEISLSFIELTNLTRDDINDFEDSTDLTLN